MLILDEASSTGDGALIWRGARDAYHSINVAGTFDGATAKLESSLDNGTSWFTVEDYVFTEAGRRQIMLPGVALIRGEIEDSGASTSISMEIE